MPRLKRATESTTWIDFSNLRFLYPHCRSTRNRNDRSLPAGRRHLDCRQGWSLRIHHLEHVDALVPLVDAVNDNIASFRLRPTGRLEQLRERYTGPLGDCRPTLLADVGRDLGPQRQPLDVVERERPRPLGRLLPLGIS